MSILSLVSMATGSNLPFDPTYWVKVEAEEDEEDEEQENCRLTMKMMKKTMNWKKNNKKSNYIIS